MAENRKPNIFVIAGIALPLLLVLLMLLAQGIGSFMVADPKYDAVFVVYDNSKTSNTQYQFSVKNAHLVVKATPLEKQVYRQPSIYIYEAKKNNVREIPLPEADPAKQGEGGVVIEGIDIPEAVKNLNPLAGKLPSPQELDVPEMKDIKINSYKVSPDGYSLEWNARRYGGFPFWGSGSYDSGYVLRKGMRRVPLPLNRGDYYYGGNSFELIGWVE